MSKFKGILDDMGINETFTKVPKKPKSYNRVKDNVPLVEDWNMMADLLFLPTAKFGFKYLFVKVDLATDEFDIEPIKNKEPVTCLKAMKKCFTRDYVKEPEYSLKTDSGNESKGVFHKYLYDESMLHKVAQPNRHQSMANVESLNAQLGRLFNGYMNKMEEKTGRVYKNWTDMVPTVRQKLNAARKRTLPDNINEYEYPVQEDTVVSQWKRYKRIEPKFKVGDEVHRALDHPTNALGTKQPTAQRRVGDYFWEKKKREIVNVITMGGRGPLYRYILEGLPNVSYTENQIM